MVELPPFTCYIMMTKLEAVYLPLLKGKLFANSQHERLKLCEKLLQKLAQRYTILAIVL
jgi:hypothetical protein